MRRWPYVSASLSAALYAWWLERRPRKYHPDVTVVNVTQGVALTGFWVGVETVILGPPDGLTSRQSARWAFGAMCGMFCATALPIWAVELWQRRRRVRALLAYLWRRDAGPQPAPATRLRCGAGLSDSP